MSLAARNPNSILQSGPDTYTRYGADNRQGLGGYIAGAAFTPGETIEHYDVSGTLKFRKTSSATNQCPRFVALERDYEVNNTGIDDDYAAGNAVEWAALKVGAIWYGIVPSGETITRGDRMQSAGDGTMKEATSDTAGDNLSWAIALDTLGNISADTRCNFMVTN